MENFQLINSFCLVKKRKIRFWILSEIRIQSWIFLKKRTLGDYHLFHANKRRFAFPCSLNWPWQTRTHCCGHIFADTNVSPFARTHNICCRHKFCVRNTKNVSDFVQKHFVSAKNVSLFCAAQETSWTAMCPQQCVLVYQGLYKKLSFSLLPKTIIN